MSGAMLFEVMTPLDFVVRCSTEYWIFISTRKHPTLAGRERDIVRVLATPDEIRRSRKNHNVLLFYQGAAPRWLCAVARREDGSGFLITAYPTDSIESGETVWIRSK